MVVSIFCIAKYVEVRINQQQEIEYQKRVRDYRRGMLYYCNHIYTPDKAKTCQEWRQ
ncbi:MAG: hypothetical protein ACFB2X_15065 [Rivularia sp. (in: cyanobacteria)]